MSHEPSGRVAAFDVIVRKAIDEAQDDNSGWSLYGSGFDRQDVVDELRQDVSVRTVDRALKDAAALGWVEDKRQGWDAGERAEEYQPAPDLPGEPVE